MNWNPRKRGRKGGGTSQRRPLGSAAENWVKRKGPDHHYAQSTYFSFSSGNTEREATHADPALCSLDEVLIESRGG